ncbi:MAG TPA: 16S rRNA (guanine(527)-N(7))-methyltransferase RsmG [Candidatus Izemoplasmatales bacterium]|nr:16S rRNA (guanine(527)-N(7))-methyltransferase RsmG [Candidatus Izemoplasmatales bacterium]
MADEFDDILLGSDLEITSEEEKTFARYYDLLAEGNTRSNLTAITGKEEVYRKHFLDSLSLAKIVDFHGKTILDVGSGAGFPSLPLKIVFPDLQVTIIESLGKRVSFLIDLTEKLGLENVKIIYGRAEEYSQKNMFDIVTARAVAKMNILTELCLPFVKNGGVFLAMKNASCEKEVEEAKEAIRILGGKMDKIVRYPISAGCEHAVVVIKKEKPTSAGYPRPFAKIKKHPL